MLTGTQFKELYRTLNESPVLSVYVDGGQSDPADRRAWRTALERGLADEGRRIAEHAPADAERFDEARRRVIAHLDQYDAFLPDRGWVGFATGDELRYAETVPVPMPDLVRWERGLRAAPYVRALKQARVVVAAVADRRRARVFTYRGGVLEEPADLIADVDAGDLNQSAVSKRAAMSTGNRGETGTDAGQRAMTVAADRLHARVLKDVQELAGRDGLVVIGGTSEVTATLARQLSDFSGRLAERPSMHVEMSDAEILASIEEAASELSRGLQAELLGEIVDAARSGGRGCLGVQDVSQALREGRVDLLFVTRSLREKEDDLVDRMVGTAFGHGGEVEELSGDAADRLDEEGEGVAARLRYTV